MLKEVRVAYDDESGTTVPGARRGSLICFSHLRWDFVFQRPQHLMSRFATTHSVHYWEEPIFEPGLAGPRLETRNVAPHLTVITPVLAEGTPEEAIEEQLRALLDDYAPGQPDVLWYYTPMMLDFSRHLDAGCIVYDCMDELANFRFAPPQLLDLEQELFERADLVFTGGYSLYEAKREKHPSVHPFPSSVDVAHFAQARALAGSPNQRPTLGFYGVIDERFDLDLLAAMADARPDWRFVMVGPVVKIEEGELPKRENIEYPGPRTYDQLPETVAGWDVALMPFAINDATRFISPTKTPEYLAAGKPVVSTPIRDVERHYGRLKGVRIAADADSFIAACEDMLALPADGEWLAEADLHLAETNWDVTQARMAALIKRELAETAADRPFVIAPREEVATCTTI